MILRSLRHIGVAECFWCMLGLMTRVRTSCADTHTRNDHGRVRAPVLRPVSLDARREVERLAISGRWLSIARPCTKHADFSLQSSAVARRAYTCLRNAGAAVHAAGFVQFTELIEFRQSDRPASR
jgi:hypothetical protein